MLHRIGPNRTIEVFYMNERQCKNYNGFHGYRETDKNYLRVGYYYGNLVGVFESERSALEHAIADIKPI